MNDKNAPEYRDICFYNATGLQMKRDSRKIAKIIQISFSKQVPENAILSFRTRHSPAKTICARFHYLYSIRFDQGFLHKLQPILAIEHIVCHEISRRTENGSGNRILIIAGIDSHNVI